MHKFSSTLQNSQNYLQYLETQLLPPSVEFNKRFIILIWDFHILQVLIQHFLTQNLSCNRGISHEVIYLLCWHKQIVMMNESYFGNLDGNDF